MRSLGVACVEATWALPGSSSQLRATLQRRSRATRSETRSSTNAARRPAAGGLVMWKDDKNYLRLDRGPLCESAVMYGGFIRNVDVVVGHARLDAEATYLRLERSGAAVRALCSADGRGRSLVGKTAFAAADPIRIGLFADGAVRPAFYPRTFAGGSEI